MIQGKAWDPKSINSQDLIARIREADYVYVHQCIAPIGLYVASHARLLGKKVFGLDAGGGDAHVLYWNPEAMKIYDGLHSLSEFGTSAFRSFEVPVYVIPGPVDTHKFCPSIKRESQRDPGKVLSVGRVLPHKGYERIIQSLPRNMELTIVGSHYDKAYVDYLIALIGRKKVRFQTDASDDDVLELMYNATVFVHASTHIDYLGRFVQKPELLGLAPLEALATGLQTIVSNAASLPELGDLPGCQVFNNEVELSDMLTQIATGGTLMVPEKEMHSEVERRFGFFAAGLAILRMMGLV